MTITKSKNSNQPRNPSVYLVENNEIRTKVVCDSLQAKGYRVQCFSGLKDVLANCETSRPEVVIVDMESIEDGAEGLETIGNMRKQLANCPPLIIVSNQQDIESRLAAVRAGASHYFNQPLDIESLIETLDELTRAERHAPFRILLINGDAALLNEYSSTLINAGMETKILIQPLDALTVINDYKPDLVLLDTDIQGCSGFELAKVIRLDHAYAQMPIVFMSSNADSAQRLISIQAGGDDLLYKPVSDETLVAVVHTRAHRASWIRRLNKDFKNALRESESLHVAMNYHDIISITNVAGRITSVNNKFCEISGYQREELLGKNHRILKSGHHSAEFYNNMWSTISKGDVWSGVICNLKKDGSEYWVDSTIVPFLDETGRPYQYVSVRTDVTAHRMSQERLQTSQNFANIGTWDWNIRTGELYWSERIGPLFGYNDDVPETTYENFLAAVHPDDRDAVVAAVNNCVEKNAEYNIEHRVVWPDGSVHWVLERGDVLRDDKGSPIHMLGVVQDISERKIMLEQLVNAKEEAENANRAKSQFLSSMSHELRTPLNAIIGFSQLLQLRKDHVLHETQKENVNEIIKAGQHLLELINEVLDLAKIEAGRINLSVENIALGEIIIESLQLISPSAVSRDITINMTHDGVAINNEQLLQQGNAIRADRTRLKQVLLNLLNNAIKYNRECGNVTIDISHHNDQTRISVIDTGVGMTQEQQKELFKPFHRMGADNTNIEGTGIGLVITKNIVELMGGSIGYESRSDEGSTFWVELPTDQRIPADQQIAGADTTQESQLLTKKQNDHTVLYIEDNPTNLRLISQVLGRHPNIHMWSAHEPMLGIDIALENVPDLILLDINLPGISGYDVFAQLRLHEATRKIPVIAISGNAMPADIKRGLSAGFYDYITKPIDINALLKSIDKALLDNNR